jgi:hypothetical protein
VQITVIAEASERGFAFLFGKQVVPFLMHDTGFTRQIEAMTLPQGNVAYRDVETAKQFPVALQPAVLMKYLQKRVAL